MDNNNEQDKQDFFETSEIKLAGKSAEDMDDSFIEPKKHHFFAKFLILLLVLLIGGACVYYFVLNTPKKTYTKIVDNVIKEEKNVLNDKNSEDLNYSYNTSVKISTSDRDAQKTLDIINNLEFSGAVKSKDDMVLGNSIIKYKSGELLDVTYKFDINDMIAYFKFNKVLDKVIKVDGGEYTAEVASMQIDYTGLVEYLLKDFELALENANYKREITKVGSSFVFKDTLLIDNTLMKEFLTKLVHDNEFLQECSKISGASASEISDGLNESIAYVDIETSEVSIYKTILKNEILKVELNFADELKVVATSEGNKYNFEINVEGTTMAKGYLKVDKTSDKTDIAFSFESAVMENISFELNMSYAKNTKDIEDLDTKNAISYEELTEDDANKIMNYMKENKTVKTLLDDLGLSDTLEEE